MQPYPTGRDVAVTTLLGGVSAFVWAPLVVLMNAYVQIPFLVSLSKQMGTSFRPWIPAYMFASEAVMGALIALVIGLPLGLLLQSRTDLMWTLFAVLYLVGFLLPMLLDGYDAASLLFVLAQPGPWLFLLFTLLFMISGRALRHRYVA